MKQYRPQLVVLLLALMFLLTACGTAGPEVVTGRDGNAYTVDTQAQTITDGTYTYSYNISGNTTTITYPNHATYTESKHGMTISIGWSEDYDPEAYPDGEILAEILSETLESSQGQRLSPFLGLLVVALGAWHLLSPETAWYVRRGWWYRDAEPSDLALTAARIAGVAFLLLGIFLLFAKIP